MKFVSVVFFLLLTHFVKAQVTYCNLELFTLKGEKFIAFANGVQLNKPSSTAARAEHLRTDVVNVKIVFSDRRLGVISKTLYLKMGQEERHMIIPAEAQNKLDKWGNDLDNKILGALGVSQNEVSTSNYVIRLSNSAPINPNAKVKVKKETEVKSGNSTYRSKSETEIEIESE